MNDPLVPGSINLRDVGGLPAEGGRTRWGVLYRSGTLAHLDAAGIQAFADLGIRRIIDLRDDEELAREPSAVTGVHIQRAPLFLGSVSSFFQSNFSLTDLYRALLADSGPRLVEAIRGIIAESPALVHCTVGKDRTGITVLLALLAAGVDPEAVIADYARTEALLPQERNTRVVQALRAIHPRAQHLEDLATRSPAPVMREIVGVLSEQYGSAADYLGSHGFTDQELNGLREILIERSS